MIRMNWILIAMAGFTLVSQAQAMDAAAAKTLAAQSACLACHAVDRKLVGPAFKDVAAKYKGTDAKALAASIKAGGAGKWGPVPMPAQAALNDDQALLLAQWVLAGAPN